MYSLSNYIKSSILSIDCIDLNLILILSVKMWYFNQREFYSVSERMEAHEFWVWRFPIHISPRHSAELWNQISLQVYWWLLGHTWISTVINIGWVTLPPCFTPMLVLWSNLLNYIFSIDIVKQIRFLDISYCSFMPM